MLVQNYGSKRMKKYERKLGNTRKKLRNSYPTQRVSWEVFLMILSSVSPSFLVCTCKKQQAKACWKCCKTHPICYRKFLFLHRNFICKKSELKIYVFDLSKRVLATEKCNEMTAIYQIQIKGQEFVQVMAGNSSKASSNQPL
jgi:hypothetical protein